MTFNEWVSPLIFILGTLTAIAAFIRAYKPIWEYLQLPKELSEVIKKIREEQELFSKKISNLENKAEKGKDVHIALLRDHILREYQYSRNTKHMSLETYQNLTIMYELYKELGGNHFIDSIMEQIEFFYQSPQNSFNLGE